MIKAFILSCLMVSLTACASTPGKNAPQLRQENKALVLGINANFARETLQELGIVRSYTQLDFNAIDGKKFDCSFWSRGRCQPYSVELPPGSHSLELRCDGRTSIFPFRHTIPDYQIHVEPGHIYQMKALGSPKLCMVYHEDITPGAPKEQFHADLDLSYWELGNQKEYFGGYMKEFVPQGIMIKNWTRLITLQFSAGHRLTALEMLNETYATRKQQCPGTELEILEQDENSITYLFSFPACMDRDIHVEMARVYTGNEGLYRLAYSEKTTEFSEATIQQYLNFFDRSGVIEQKSSK